MPRDDGLYVDHKAMQCGPWYSTPQSSRVKRFRYDYGNEMIQIQWTNEDAPWSNPGYVYSASWEEFRGLVRAASKGKRINNPINDATEYRPMVEEEYTAPVVRTSAPMSRAKKIDKLEFE